MSDKTVLLLIDCQADFCNPSGSLYVPGADLDCARLADALICNLSKVDHVIATLDTHHKQHIAHRYFWIDPVTKAHPAPFTSVCQEDIDAGKITTTRKEDMYWAQVYLARLHDDNKESGVRPTVLTIWPDHCLVGTTGHNLYYPIQQALQEWERQTDKQAQMVLKGFNNQTEHYSVFRAEVEVTTDKINTEWNKQLIRQLDGYGRIVVAGQARSHCVNLSVRDLVSKVGPHKVYVATDACSDVIGFQEMGDQFEKDMREKGVRFGTIAGAFGKW